MQPVTKLWIWDKEEIFFFEKLMIWVLNMVGLSAYGIPSRQLEFYNSGTQKDGS